MAACIYCKAEILIRSDEIPICLYCSNTSPGGRVIRSKLYDGLAEAKRNVELASTEFNAITKDIPSSLPFPDGTQRIQNAARKLFTARDQMMKAHNRLSEYLERGTVPEDLKRR